MRFRVFPFDLEGVGCYRIIYPYGLIEQHTEHDVQVGFDGPVVREDGRSFLNVPEAVLGGKNGPDADLFLDADLYVLQRPLELVYAPLAAWLKKHGKQVIVDLDDYMHGIPTGNLGQAAIERSPRHDLKALLATLRHTDLLTVSTPALADLYGHLVPRTLLVRNHLLKRDWTSPLAYEQDRPLRVGWQGWLQYRGQDLRVLKRMMRKWLRKNRQVIFVNVGKPDLLTYLDIPRDQRIHVQGARFPGHAPLLANIDIQLVPLVLNEFNEAKSALKAMEAGAAGSPVIASPSSENKLWLDSGNGLLANTPNEWVEALDAMVHDEAWRTMGQANRAKVERHWLDDGAWEQWLAPYRSTSSSPVTSNADVSKDLSSTAKA